VLLVHQVAPLYFAQLMKKVNAPNKAALFYDPPCIQRSTRIGQGLQVQLN